MHRGLGISNPKQSLTVTIKYIVDLDLILVLRYEQIDPMKNETSTSARVSDLTKLSPNYNTLPENKKAFEAKAAMNEDQNVRTHTRLCTKFII